MIKTMIALVSDQRMQNVIPILQKGANYERLVLVMSKERRTEKPLPRYIESANDLTAVLEPRLKVITSDKLVDPYNIEAVTEVVGLLLEKYGGQSDVVMNISGGTKPMAIGALRAAQVAQVTCLYTNTEDGEILWLSPDGSIQTESIQVVGLDVSLYIRAYGEQVASSQKATDLDLVYRTWAEMIGDNHKVIYQKVVNLVTETIKKAYKNRASEDESIFPVTCWVEPTRRQREIIEQVAQKGLWEWDQNLGKIRVTNKQAANFLLGTWVEIYVTTQMQRNSLFDDVRLNVKLVGVEGEIDIAAVNNGKLILIECKSNVQRAQQLSKLDSFRRRLGGPYAQAYYARASEAYASRIRKQCQKFRLNGVFFGGQLRDIGQEISKGI